jgi:hypothetical protein
VFDARPFIGNGLANAFAYDSGRDQFFFLDGNMNLQFWDRGPTMAPIATKAQLGLLGQYHPDSAVYYNNAYWCAALEGLTPGGAPPRTARAPPRAAPPRRPPSAASAPNSPPPRRPAPTRCPAPTLAPRAPPPPAPARFVHNSFKFLTTQTLVKVSLTYDAQGRPSFGSATEYPIDIKDANGNPVSAYEAFGDIVMTPGGRMYFANTGTPRVPNTAQFYTLDTTTLSTAPGSNTATVIRSGNPPLQTSFSCDFKTLWAQNQMDCQWYTIDVATGVPTPAFKLPLVGTNTCLRDLGGAACT